MCRQFINRLRLSLLSLGSLTAVLLFSCLYAKAQQSTLQPRTTYIGLDGSIGGGVVENTYLSPLRYGGTEYGLHLVIEHPITSYRPLLLRLASDLSYLYSLNPAKNAKLERIRFAALCETHYRFDLPYQIKFSLGGGVRALVGGNYLPSNVNNQASGDMKFDIISSMQLAYMLPVRLFPATLRLYTNCRIVGLAHQVGYNQSYFEMYYLGGGFARSLRFTHLGNAAQASLCFSVDMPIANFCTLRLGYRLDWDKMKLQNRISSSVSHGGFLGFSFDTLWFSGREAVQSLNHRPALFP